MPVAVLVVGTIFGILGGVGVLSLILWFKLKKKEEASCGTAVTALGQRPS